MPDFVARTGVDLVAVTIGNVHGRDATNPPVLDFQRLADIHKAIDRPLVLHIASGLSPSVVHATMKIGGICKLHVNTEGGSDGRASGGEGQGCAAVDDGDG